MFAASQLSRKLISRGGEEIAEQCKDKTKCIRLSKKFRITRAGKLRCRFVAHLVLNSNNLQEEVPLDLFEVFKAVDELEQYTIAIPAIGTGNEISNLRNKSAVYYECEHVCSKFVLTEFMLLFFF